MFCNVLHLLVCGLEQHLVSHLGPHVLVLQMSVKQISKHRPAVSPSLPLIVRLQSQLAGLVQDVIELNSQVGECLSLTF